jgi:type I restriction enzyme M protein
MNNKVGDFFWAYADILRKPYNITNNIDIRILGFMALKLLCDNDKLKFNFDYKNDFNIKCDSKDNTQQKLIKIVTNLAQYSNTSDNFKLINFDYLIEEQGFNLLGSIKELSNEHLEAILDIYIQKADFSSYPKEDYKDLYEQTITRMEDKQYKGDLLGQHFTQKSIIHLMCEMAIPSIKNREKIAIYDPSCGSGSMLMESYYYFKNHTKTKDKDIEVYGQEFDKRVYLLCCIFLEISDIDYNIAYGDTLLNPAFVNGINGDDSFDFIIANPPFGVDWKHSYDEVIQKMKKDENFLVVKDEKDKIITPKKSDGQFLFMLHILKLLINEKTKKDGFAGIISSSTLITSGNNTSSESKIRKKIFETNMLKAIIEQPKAMFTNTDITSHIWFFDTSNINDSVKILKTTNDEKMLFSKHPSHKGKMKHSYTKDNIKEIIKLINQKKDIKYISKNIKVNDKYEINIQNEIGKKSTFIDVPLGNLSNNFNNFTDNYCDKSKVNIW